MSHHHHCSPTSSSSPNAAIALAWLLLACSSSGPYLYAFQQQDQQSLRLAPSSSAARGSASWREPLQFNHHPRAHHRSSSSMQLYGRLGDNNDDVGIDDKDRRGSNNHDAPRRILQMMERTRRLAQQIANQEDNEEPNRDRKRRSVPPSSFSWMTQQLQSLHAYLKQQREALLEEVQQSFPLDETLDQQLSATSSQLDHMESLLLETLYRPLTDKEMDLELENELEELSQMSAELDELLLPEFSSTNQDPWDFLDDDAQREMRQAYDKARSSLSRLDQIRQELLTAEQTLYNDMNDDMLEEEDEYEGSAVATATLPATSQELVVEEEEDDDDDYSNELFYSNYEFEESTMVMNVQRRSPSSSLDPLQRIVPMRQRQRHANKQKRSQSSGGAPARGAGRGASSTQHSLSPHPPESPPTRDKVNQGNPYEKEEKKTEESDESGGFLDVGRLFWSDVTSWPGMEGEETSQQQQQQPPVAPQNVKNGHNNENNNKQANSLFSSWFGSAQKANNNNNGRVETAPKTNGHQIQPQNALSLPKKKSQNSNRNMLSNLMQHAKAMSSPEKNNNNNKNMLSNLMKQVQEFEATVKKSVPNFGNDQKDRRKRQPTTIPRRTKRVSKSFRPPRPTVHSNTTAQIVATDYLKSNPLGKALPRCKVDPVKDTMPLQWARMQSFAQQQDPFLEETRKEPLDPSSSSVTPGRWSELKQWASSTQTAAAVPEREQEYWALWNQIKERHAAAEKEEEETLPATAQDTSVANEEPSIPNKYQVILDWAAREQASPSNTEVLYLLRAQRVAAAQAAGAKPRWGDLEEDRAVDLTNALRYGASGEKDDPANVGQPEQLGNEEPLSEEEVAAESIPDRYASIMAWAEKQEVTPTWNQILYLLRSQRVASAARVGKSRWSLLENEHAMSVTDALLDLTAKTTFSPTKSTVPEAKGDGNASSRSLSTFDQPESSMTTPEGEQGTLLAEPRLDPRTNPPQTMKTPQVGPIGPRVSANASTPFIDALYQGRNASIPQESAIGQMADTVRTAQRKPGHAAPLLYQMRSIRVVAQTASMKKSRWGAEEVARAQQMVETMASTLSTKTGRLVTMDQLAEEWKTHSESNALVVKSIVTPIGGCPPLPVQDANDLNEQHQTSVESARLDSGEAGVTDLRQPETVRVDELAMDKLTKEWADLNGNEDFSSGATPAFPYTPPTTEPERSGAPQPSKMSISAVDLAKAWLSANKDKEPPDAAPVFPRNLQVAASALQNVTDSTSLDNASNTATKTEAVVLKTVTEQKMPAIESQSNPKGKLVFDMASDHLAANEPSMSMDKTASEYRLNNNDCGGSRVSTPMQPSTSTPSASPDSSLFASRSVNVATAAEAGKSRWGRMENVKARQMVGSIQAEESTKKSNARQPQGRFEGEKTIDTTLLGSYPIGGIPRRPITLWKHPSADPEIKRNGAKSLDELARERGANRHPKVPQTSTGPTRVEQQTKGSRTNEVSSTDGRHTSTAHGENILEGLPDGYRLVAEWAKQQPVPPSSNHVSYLLRNYKLASFASAGKSRWSNSENMRAQYERNAMIEAVSAEEHTYVLDEGQTSKPDTTISPPLSLYQSRSVRIATSDSGGHRQRWGAMEVSKAQQMAESIAKAKNAQHVSMDQVAKEWSAWTKDQPNIAASLSTQGGQPPPPPMDQLADEWSRTNGSPPTAAEEETLTDSSANNEPDSSADSGKSIFDLAREWMAQPSTESMPPTKQKEEDIAERELAAVAAERAEQTRIKLEKQQARIQEDLARMKKEAEENARAVAKQEEQARLRLAKIEKEAEEKARKAAEEARLKAQAEERARFRAKQEAKAKTSEETRLKAEVEERARIKAQKEAEKARKAAEEAMIKAKQEEEARHEAEAAKQARMKALQEEEARLKALAEAKARKAAEEAKLKAEDEKQARIKAQQEEEARLKALAEAKARKAAVEARQKSEAEEQARIKAQQEEERLKALAEAKARKAAEEAKLKAEAEKQARIKAQQEEEARMKAVAEEKARKAAEEARLKAAAEEQARIKAQQEEARLKAVAEEKARKAAEEARLKAEAEAQARREKVRLKAESEKKARKAAEEARQKAKAEEDSRQRQFDARLKANREAKMKAELELQKMKDQRKARESEMGPRPTIAEMQANQMELLSQLSTERVQKRQELQQKQTAELQGSQSGWQQATKEGSNNIAPSVTMDVPETQGIVKPTCEATSDVSKHPSLEQLAREWASRNSDSMKQQNVAPPSSSIQRVGQEESVLISGDEQPPVANEIIDQSQFQDRSVKVAQTAAAGKSRWGAQENAKAQQMADAIEEIRVQEQTISPEQLAREWEAMNRGQPVAPPTNTGEILRQLKDSSTRITPLQVPSSNSQTQSSPLASMEQLAREWAGMNKEKRESKHTFFPPNAEEKQSPSSKPQRDVESIPDVPDRYNEVMCWAAREPVPPTLKHVVYQLRNYNVASYAAVNKSRWGHSESKKAESLVSEIRESAANQETE